MPMPAVQPAASRHPPQPDGDPLSFPFEGEPPRRFEALLRELAQAHEAELAALRKRIRGAPEVRKPQFRSEATQSADRVVESEMPSPESSNDMQRDWSIMKPRERGLSQIAAHIVLPAEHKPLNFLQRIVFSKFFEMLFCGLVVLNSFALAFESRYHGQNVGYTLRHDGYVQTANELYSYGEGLINALSWIFGVLFVIELLLRIGADLRVCIRDPWVWFDAFVVLVWTISKFESVVGIDSTIFRLFRLLRLLRLLKLARTLKEFDSLFTITTAIRGCFSILFWTFITFGLVQLLLSLFLTQYLHTFYFPSQAVRQDLDQKLVFKYYGTFVRSYFSLWEITLGNWPPACRVLAENVNEAFFVFGLTHKLVIGFAVVAIINGVFIQETFKVTARDDVIMVRQQHAAIKQHIEKMRKLWRHAGTHTEDTITIDEWDRLMQDPGVKTWLASMELNADDARLVFELINESNDGKISFEELVSGVAKLKGPAKSIDLHWLARQQLKFHKSLLLASEVQKTLKPKLTKGLSMSSLSVHSLFPSSRSHD